MDGVPSLEELLIALVIVLVAFLYSPAGKAWAKATYVDANDA